MIQIISSAARPAVSPLTDSQFTTRQTTFSTSVVGVPGSTPPMLESTAASGTDDRPDAAAGRAALQRIAIAASTAAAALERERCTHARIASVCTNMQHVLGSPAPFLCSALEQQQLLHADAGDAGMIPTPVVSGLSGEGGAPVTAAALLQVWCASFPSLPSGSIDPHTEIPAQGAEVHRGDAVSLLQPLLLTMCITENAVRAHSRAPCAALSRAVSRVQRLTARLQGHEEAYHHLVRAVRVAARLETHSLSLLRQRCREPESGVAPPATGTGEDPLRRFLRQVVGLSPPDRLKEQELYHSRLSQQRLRVLEQLRHNGSPVMPLTEHLVRKHSRLLLAQLTPTARSSQLLFASTSGACTDLREWDGLSFLTTCIAGLCLAAPRRRPLLYLCHSLSLFFFCFLLLVCRYGYSDMDTIVEVPNRQTYRIPRLSTLVLMLVAQRIAAFRQATVTLQRCGAVAGAEPAGQRSSSTGAAARRRYSPALREKYLFRRVPISLSLVERSLVKVASRAAKQCRAERSAIAAPKSDAGPLSLPSFLDDLVPPEDTPAPAPAPAPPVAAPSPPLLSARMLTALMGGLYAAEAERRRFFTEAQARYQRRTAAAPQRKKGCTRADLEDLVLLQRSPCGAAVPVGPALAPGGRGVGKGAGLRRLLWWWSSLTAGVLQDVVRGRQPLSRAAPRFVASLPSRTRRHGKERKEGEGEGEGPCGGTMNAAQALEHLLNNEGPAAEVNISKPGSGSSSSTQKPRPRPVVRLSWMPPPSTELRPLLVETLALWAELLPSLEAAPLRLGGAAEGASNGGAGHVATATLLLHSGGGMTKAEAATLSSALSGLQAALLEAVGTARQALYNSTQSETSAADLMPPMDAAQVLLGLHRLQSLSTASPVAQHLVAVAATHIFPQLRTNTWQALLAKGQQTSLLSFITRSQAAKLRRHSRRPGDLLESAVQRSRLEQRRLAASLRDAHLNEVQRSTLLKLGQGAPSLRPPHAAVEPQAARNRRGASSPTIADRDVVLMAALLVAEAVLLAGVLHASDPSDTSAVLSLEHVADTWLAVAVLKPLVEQRRRSHQGGGSGQSDAHLVKALAGHVLRALQERIAAEVSRLDAAGQAAPAVSSRLLACLHKTCCGVVEWVGPGAALHDEARSRLPLYPEVHATAQLVKLLLLRHAEPLRAVGMKDDSREAFEKVAATCLQGVGLLDSAAEAALSCTELQITTKRGVFIGVFVVAAQCFSSETQHSLRTSVLFFSVLLSIICLSLSPSSFLLLCVLMIIVSLDLFINLFMSMIVIRVSVIIVSYNRMPSICKCSRRLWSFFSFGSKVAVVGGVAGAVHYGMMYHTIAKDRDSVDAALRHAGVVDSNIYDVAIVGGGIIGVATAREIRKKWPNKSVILLEKEGNVAQHQSGHPSGCIHAGMYYTPGTAMARLCPRGAELLVDYCKKFRLPYKMCGKMIVATEEEHAEVIQQLYDNGIANGVKGLQILRDPKEIHAKEPLVDGLMALYSRNTGMVDFGAVTKHMRDQLVKNAKGMFSVRYNFKVMDFVGVQIPSKLDKNSPPGAGVVPKEVVVIRGKEEGQVGPEKRIIARNVITCCGLGADSVADKTNLRGWWGPKVLQMYSFRGKYYQLKGDKQNLVQMHVYPCPDLSKGLSVGIHISPTINTDRGNNTILGPGSAFAFHPYGYSPYDVDFKYLFNSVFSSGGFVSLLSNWRTLLDTYRVDLCKQAFLGEVQKLIPSVTAEDIEESFSGVMSMGVATDGTLCSDLSLDYTRPKQTIAATVDKHRPIFSFVPHHDKMVQENSFPLIVHVRNAPSPAATASLAIAEEIVTASSLAFMWHVNKTKTCERRKHAIYRLSFYLEYKKQAGERQKIYLCTRSETAVLKVGHRMSSFSHARTFPPVLGAQRWMGAYTLRCTLLSLSLFFLTLLRSAGGGADMKELDAHHLGHIGEGGATRDWDMGLRRHNKREKKVRKSAIKRCTARASLKTKKRKEKLTFNPHIYTHFPGTVNIAVSVPRAGVRGGELFSFVYRLSSSIFILLPNSLDVLSEFSDTMRIPQPCREAGGHIGNKRVALALWLQMLLFTLLLGPYMASTAAWSSPGALAIVVLPSYAMVPNSSVWDTFYHAPAGSALLSLSAEGHRIAGGSLDKEEPSVLISTHHLAETAAVYLDRYSIPVPAFLRVPLLLQANLSGTWEVLAKPSSKTLLHCRLPYPLTLNDVRSRESEALRRHGTAMSDALMQWWRVVTSPDGFYGDAEQSLTGVKQWYIICPDIGVYRVNGGNLLSALLMKQKKKREREVRQCLRPHLSLRGEISLEAEDEDEAGGAGIEPAAPTGSMFADLPPIDDIDDLVERRKKIEKKVLATFEQDHLRCGPTLHRLLATPEEPLFQAAFFRVGDYDPDVSRPQWNDALRAWEMWLPSTNPCTELAAPNSINISAHALWRTRILLKCYADRGSAEKGGYGYEDIGKDARRLWRITEVRQRCLIEVELTSDLICLWDDYLDHLHVNPVPCVEMARGDDGLVDFHVETLEFFLALYITPLFP
eukprot:gene6747-4840_t